MKKILNPFFVVVVMCMAVFGAWKMHANLNEKSNRASLIFSNDIEALSSSECLSGGIGSTGCSISGGVTIVGNGTTATCSVSCAAGYYACCSLTGCHCNKS